MAVVPASHTFATTAATSSEANTFIRDPIAFLLNPPIAELRQTVAQTLVTGAAFALTFTTEDVDTDPTAAGGHSTSVNTSRFTAVYAGWYQVSGTAGFPSNATGRRTALWAVNGTLVNAGESDVPAMANGLSVVARTKHIYLTVGDYVELFAQQDSGASLTTTLTIAASSMSIRWVSN